MFVYFKKSLNFGVTRYAAKHNAYYFLEDAYSCLFYEGAVFPILPHLPCKTVK